MMPNSLEPDFGTEQPPTITSWNDVPNPLHGARPGVADHGSWRGHRADRPVVLRCRAGRSGAARRCRHLRCGPAPDRRPVADKDDLVETSLRRAGLWNEISSRLGAPGGGLSGGQQQRLCIARALAVRPIEDTIAELCGQVTIVIVTHNMQQAARVSQKCAFFLATDRTPGHIVEAGPTEQMFDGPTDPRTADYVHGRFG